MIERFCNAKDLTGEMVRGVFLQQGVIGGIWRGRVGELLRIATPMESIDRERVGGRHPRKPFPAEHNALCGSLYHRNTKSRAVLKVRGDRSIWGGLKEQREGCFSSGWMPADQRGGT